MPDLEEPSFLPAVMDNDDLSEDKNKEVYYEDLVLK